MSCIVEGRLQRGKGIRSAPKDKSSLRGHVNRRRQGIPVGYNGFHKNKKLLCLFEAERQD